MPVNVGATIDVAASIAKIIGDTATAAMQVGNVVLPILQDVGLLFPPAAIAANYVNVAMPYITEISKYAPAVQVGLQNNKPLIEAAIGVGSALLSPLASLMQAIPELAGSHEFFISLDAFLKGNEFTPQDPRFDRAQGTT